MISVDWHLIINIWWIKSCSVPSDLTHRDMSASLSGCLSFHLHTQIWETKRIRYKCPSQQQFWPFALFLLYILNSWVFKKTLKLQVSAICLSTFKQHTLLVFSVCKQQIYSLSVYIPRKRTEGICCTYVVKCKIHSSNFTDYYPLPTLTSSSGSACTRHRTQPIPVTRAGHEEISQT
jgi:hypothetical protein